MQPLTYEKVYDFIHEILTQDIEFFKTELKGYENVLELGCGTGRILLPLIEAGFQCSGLDISKEMLAICKEKMLAQNVDTQKNQLMLGNMKSFKIERKFDAVIIPFNTFLYMATYEEQLSCLQSIYTHLEENGKFILDVFNPLYILSNRQEGVLYHELSKFHESRQSLINFYSSFFYEDNYFHWNQFFEEMTSSGVTKFFRKMILKAFFETELRALAQFTGFRVQNVYGSYKKDKTHRQGPNLLAILTK